MMARARAKAREKEKKATRFNKASIDRTLFCYLINSILFLSAGLAVGAYLLFFLGVTALQVIIPFVPLLFGISFAIETIFKLKKVCITAFNIIKYPWMNTPVNRLRLYSQGIKLAAVAIMTAATIPLFMGIGATFIVAGLANPFTAPPVLIALSTVIACAIAAFVITRVVKNYFLRKRLEEAAQHLVENDINPYVKLGFKSEEAKLQGLNFKKALDAKVASVKKDFNLNAKEKTEKLSRIYRYYEVLKYPYSRRLYHAFDTIKNGIKGQPVETPETVLKLTSAYQKYFPFASIAYRREYRLAGNDMAKRERIEFAKLMLNNPVLYDYQQSLLNSRETPRTEVSFYGYEGEEQGLVAKRLRQFGDSTVPRHIKNRVDYSSYQVTAATESAGDAVRNTMG